MSDIITQDEEIRPITDTEAIYDTEIAPLVDQLRAICEQHNIPSVLAFQVSNEEDGGTMAVSNLVPPNAMIELKLMALVAADKLDYSILGIISMMKVLGK